MQTQILVVLVITIVSAEENWVWSNKGQRDLNDVDIEISEKSKTDEFASYQRERESTTKRPALINEQEDDIDRYSESENENYGSRDTYQTNGFNLRQLAGFTNFPINGPLNPTFGNEANGILVGPGGPTGLIGRSQIPYSLLNGGGYSQGLGTSFMGIGQIPVGYPDQNQLIHSGFNGLGSPQGHNIYGSVPVSPFPNAQYPQNVQFSQSQFGTNVPFPGQYAPYKYSPAPGTQYPSAYNNGYSPVPIKSSYSPFGTVFDDYDNTKRKIKVEEKSLATEINNVGKRLDDKVSKSLKRA